MVKSASASSLEVENPAVATEDAIPVASEETTSRLAQADKVVWNNVYWSMGIGAIPVPIVDLVGLAGFQLRLTKQISELYGVAWNEHAARNIIGALIGTIGGGIVTRLALVSLVKTLPFAGAFVGGVVAMPVIAGASTYALGRVFVNHFEKGGDFLSLSPDKVKGYFKDQYEVGKKAVGDAVKRTKEAPAAETAAAN